MPWYVTDDPVHPEAAISFFRKKTAITKPAWMKLQESARDQAFTVAGTANLDVVADVWKAIDAAIANGTDFREFAASVADRLEAAWGGTVQNPGQRLDTIFRTNVQKAYSAGRFEQMTDPDVIEDRPYWLFDATIDGATSEICKALHGTVRPADDPWWKGRVPPCHFGCRSQLITLTPEQAEKYGGVSKAPKIRSQTGFGGPPGELWKPDPSKYPPELWAIHEENNT